MTPHLSAKNLHIANNKRSLFSSFSHDFYAGRITAVIGENGVGKSTLLDHLAGIKFSATGELFLDGKELRHYSVRERCQKIASLGQQDRFSDDMLVLDRIAQGLVPRLGPSFSLSGEIMDMLIKAATATGVEHLLHRVLGALSGGERKRVNIARCLVDEKALIYILDEPFAGVDLRHQKKLMQTFKNTAMQNKSVILSLHDLDLIKNLPDEIIGLGQQQIIAQGPRQNVAVQETLNQIFGLEE